MNCGAIPEGILESELFGHEKGSFTGAASQRKGYFELADQGSIFLDEIGELPTSIQVKLLRVLEEREFMRVGGSSMHKVNVRVITATNKNLADLVKAGHFRQDLYYRLNAVHIRVPSLRERQSDVAPLAKKFADDFCKENHIDFEGFTKNALETMQHYSWPGNIRELKNLVEKIIVLERGRKIDDYTLNKYLTTMEETGRNMPVLMNKSREDLDQELLLRALLEIKSEIAQLRELLLSGHPQQPSLGAWREELPNEYQNHYNGSSAESVTDMEKELINSALNKTNGNKRQAAKILGMSERTLYRKINKYGLRNDQG
ncbi:MAG: sigma-54 dependent transcriptional regulator [candidate division KSB1 bacterium]|nr:sigma-54 dependent transcriptional regulator [candidate division KSB1 bacterium]